MPVIAHSLAFSPDGKTLAGGRGAVQLWDAETGALKGTLQAEYRGVLAVAFTADGKTLAGADGHSLVVGPGATIWVSEVCIWDVASGKVQRRLTDLGPWIRCLAFSPDGKTLATGTSGPIKRTGFESRVTSEVRLWDAATGKLLRTVGGPLGQVWSVAFSPDSRAVLSCDDEVVALTDVETGERKQTLMTQKLGRPGE